MNNFSKKIISLILILVLNWAGLSAIGETIAYFNDQENTGGVFTAGVLDFFLASPDDFSPAVIALGETAVREIVFINADNIPKYNVRAASSTGALCDYLNLEARLDGGALLYSGPLLSFIYGPVVFAEPDIWLFALTLPADAPASLVSGQTCDFKFVFSGSQTRNDLPFGTGFNDTEEATNTISAKVCYNSQTKTIGYWKKHPEIYVDFLPQTVGSTSVDTVQQANNIFKNAKSKTMRLMLEAQLLAMKFNIAYFGIGDYLPENSSSTLSEIVQQADDLLRQNPEPAREVLEAMKTFLDDLNNLHQITYCSGAPPLTFSPTQKVKGADTDTAADWEDLGDPNAGTNPEHLTMQIQPIFVGNGLFLSFMEGNADESNTEPEIGPESEPAMETEAEAEQENNDDVATEIIEASNENGEGDTNSTDTDTNIDTNENETELLSGQTFDNQSLGEEETILEENSEIFASESTPLIIVIEEQPVAVPEPENTALQENEENIGDGVGSGDASESAN